MTVGEIIQQARKQQHLSLTQVALQSSVSEAIIHRLEHHNDAKFHAVVQVARVLAIPPAVLFDAVPPPYEAE